MKLGWRFGLIVLIVGAALGYLYPIDKSVTLGLDLKGGMYLTLEVDLAKLHQLKPDANDEDAVNRALEIIRSRVDQFGVAEPLIVREGRDRIIVQLPGVQDPLRARQLIGKTATLEFKMVHDEFATTTGALPSGYERASVWKKNENNEYLPVEELVLRSQAELTGEHLTRARIQWDNSGVGGREPGISIEFDEVGTERFAEITTANFQKRLAIVLDGKIMSAPVINEPIRGGKAQITGNFSQEEANDLRIILESGSLPAPVNIVEDRTIGPTLGRESIDKGVRAAVVGLMVVALFMIVYYRFGGFMANLAVLLNIIILLGGMAMMHATLTLPGIAGIILTIGMAVDANVLIFERMREELRLGKTIRAAVEAGYSKALSAIIDSNVTTVLAAVILYQFGSGPIKGFAVTLTWGLVASMFTAIFVTRALFEAVLRNPNVRTLSV